MKKKLLSLPLILTSLLVTSCNEVDPFINLKEVEYEATKIKQTYMDYFKHTWYGLSATPSVGNPKLLVLPIWFTDSDLYLEEEHKEDIREDINTAYFGTVEDTGWHSVKSYYEEESQHTFVMDGVTAPWYHASENCEFYGKDKYGNEVTKLVNEATNYFFNNSEYSRKDFDDDGDGYLDGVIAIYAAPDNQQEGMWEYSQFWAYTTWLQLPANINKPNANAMFWSSYDFMYSRDDAIERTGAPYAHGDTRFCNVDAHTMIHEMGHMFGLSDYYDYSYEYSCAAGFSMQDNNVGGHDPYSVMSLGWADPFIPTESCEITIKDFQSSHQLILLTDEWNKYDSSFDEYVLLELYSPTGLNEADTIHRYEERYPKGVDKVGFRVWHVDARVMRSYPSSKFYSDVTASDCYLAFNDSYDGSAPSGVAFADYKQLQLIKNDSNAPLRSKTHLKEKDLFYEGDRFYMSSFASQFVNGSKTNKNKDLGWSFKIKEITDNGDGTYSATVALLRS